MDHTQIVGGDGDNLVTVCTKMQQSKQALSLNRPMS